MSRLSRKAFETLQAPPDLPAPTPAQQALDAELHDPVTVVYQAAPVINLAELGYAWMVNWRANLPWKRRWRRRRMYWRSWGIRQVRRVYWGLGIGQWRYRRRLRQALQDLEIQARQIEEEKADE